MNANQKLASRWMRLGGALLEGLISAMIVMPIMIVTRDLWGIDENTGPSLLQHLAAFVLGWAVFILLNGHLLVKRGQTIGKAIIGTKIVDEHGGIPDLGKMLFFRYFIPQMLVLVPELVLHIPLLGPAGYIANVLFIFGKEHRCLHDQLAGTWVVDAKEGQQQEAATARDEVGF